jgi:hypothetical protein
MSLNKLEYVKLLVPFALLVSIQNSILYFMQLFLVRLKLVPFRKISCIMCLLLVSLTSSYTFDRQIMSRIKEKT